MLYLGVNIGGTKSSVSLGKVIEGELVDLKRRHERPTKDYSYTELIHLFCQDMNQMLDDNDVSKSDVKAIGISCGNPLSSKNGTILSPPNLPGWDNVPIVDMIREEMAIDTYLCNDANGGALAESMFGAGKGVDNMVFLTFGTGMGAGIMANGRLVEGASDSAGEVGHVRLEDQGPVGYGKRGSFEGYCSGGGIAQLARQWVTEELQMGREVDMLKEHTIDELSAKIVCEYAFEGDPLALAIVDEVAYHLGRGLSIIIDILNPSRIILGSIYHRSGVLFETRMQEIIEKETLIFAREACEILPSSFGESIGNVSAISIAAYYAKQECK